MALKKKKKKKKKQNKNSKKHLSIPLYLLENQVKKKKTLEPSKK